MNTIQALSFSPITLAHRARYEEITRDLCPDADHAFANLYMWQDLYHQSIAFFDEGNCHRAVIRFCTENGCRYLFPAGRGEITPVLMQMRENARQRGEFLAFVGVTEAQLQELPLSLRSEFEITENRDIADYLYSAESLATLAGKKLHAKRNHINAFTAARTWEVYPLTPEHADTCRALFARWAEGREPLSVAVEQAAIERALSAFTELGLEGALLLADSEPAAFTVGSMVTSDTLCVHIEKGRPDMNGVFPLINREFVRMMLEKHPTLTTVNREDDMGLENLRKAKMAYRPLKLLTKYTLLDTSPKSTNTTLL